MDKDDIIKGLTDDGRGHRLLAENMTDVVWVMDGRLNFTYVSPSVQRVTGYTRKEMLNLSARELTTFEDLSRVARRVSAELDSRNPDSRERQSITVELRQRKKDGTWMDTEVSLGFFFNDDREIMGILGVTRDITERNRAVRALRESEDAGGYRADVLLVEDSPTNRMVSIAAMEKTGCRVDVAENGEQALHKLERKRYDIVFMDCQMPLMDGFEATRRLRLMEGTRRHTPVVAMTANAMAGDRERCLVAGMDEYIPKPVRQSSLAAIMDRFCWRFRTRPRPPIARVLVAVRDEKLRQAAIDAAGEAFDGSAVRTADSGVEALTLLGGFLPDLFVYDPGFDDVKSEAVAGFLDKSPRYSTMTVVAASADKQAGSFPKGEPVLEDPRKLRKRILALAGMAGTEPPAPEPVDTPPTPTAGKPPDTGDGLPVFEPETMMSAIGDDPGVLREFVNIFLADMPDQMDRLARAVTDGQWDVAERLAHRVKGSAADVGGARLRRAALELETAAREHRRPGRENLLQVVTGEFEALGRALRDYSRTLETAT